ncbi:MAG: hypothetical protein AB1733_19710 [Thermodesulfobacteriota bacterium]
MAEYKASSPNTELLGGMIYSLWGAFPEGFQALVKKVLVKHGVAEVNPEAWYRLQPVLDALKEVEQMYGHHLLFQVGEQAATRAPLPPEINSFRACMFAMNATLQKIHRGGDAGGYVVTEEELPGGLVRYRVVASTPFPCSLTRGYLEGYAKRFRTADSTEVLVRHDDDSPCRRQGADTCTYIVTLW